MRPILLALTLTAALAGAVPAAAVPYRFDVTDPDASIGGKKLGSYYFFLDSMPTPLTFTSSTFTVSGLTYSTTFSSNVTFDSFTFYTAAGGGGFDDLENVYEGPQLFTGTTAHPVFRLGTFAIDDFQTNGSVTISAVAQVAAAAPEPATWATMIVGLGIAGATLRRRTNVRVRFA